MSAASSNGSRPISTISPPKTAPRSSRRSASYAAAAPSCLACPASDSPRPTSDRRGTRCDHAHERRPPPGDRTAPPTRPRRPHQRRPRRHRPDRLCHRPHRARRPHLPLPPPRPPGGTPHRRPRTIRPHLSAGPTVTQASLQADLANAGARTARLAARVQQLEKRLSHALGEQAWRELGLGAPADIDEQRRTITQLEQRNVDLASRLEEREVELEAARAANRELTRALNQRG